MWHLPPPCQFYHHEIIFLVEYTFILFCYKIVINSEYKVGWNYYKINEKANFKVKFKQIIGKVECVVK